MLRLFTFLIISALLLHAEHIRWFGNYDMALQQAIKEQKPMMVLLVSPECSACQHMLSETLKESPSIAWINETFVPVLVTKGQKSSFPIEMLYTLTYPSIFFLTPHELFLEDPIIGEASSKEFEIYLEKMKD